MKKATYQNMDGVRNDHKKGDFVRWYKERFSKDKDLLTTISVNHKPEMRKIHQQMHDSITWNGHASFLIQLNGMNVITDPVWAKFMGTTKRAVASPIALNTLPPIDYVLLSHGHYDHLHFKSIKNLPGNPLCLVPAGLKKLFLRRGFADETVVEFNWWDSIKFNRLSISFVPAQHWVRRGMFDMNTSHWGGWIVQSEQNTIYFAGDSGYFRGFKEIAAKMPSIDYALMPIGAYEPEWFMELDHMTPEQAVQAFLDLKAGLCIPMHYGTYRLADDTGPEAIQRFEKEWERKGLHEERKSVLHVGSTLWLSK